MMQVSELNKVRVMVSPEYAEKGSALVNALGGRDVFKLLAAGVVAAETGNFTSPGWQKHAYAGLQSWKPELADLKPNTVPELLDSANKVFKSRTGGFAVGFYTDDKPDYVKGIEAVSTYMVHKAVRIFGKELSAKPLSPMTAKLIIKKTLSLYVHGSQNKPTPLHTLKIAQYSGLQL